VRADHSWPNLATSPDQTRSPITIRSAAPPAASPRRSQRSLAFETGGRRVAAAPIRPQKRPLMDRRLPQDLASERKCPMPPTKDARRAARAPRTAPRGMRPPRRISGATVRETSRVEPGCTARKHRLRRPGLCTTDPRPIFPPVSDAVAVIAVAFSGTAGLAGIATTTYGAAAQRRWQGREERVTELRKVLDTAAVSVANAMQAIALAHRELQGLDFDTTPEVVGEKRISRARERIDEAVAAEREIWVASNFAETAARIHSASRPGPQEC
jgi:hypothetical protein